MRLPDHVYKVMKEAYHFFFPRIESKLIPNTHKEIRRLYLDQMSQTGISVILFNLVLAYFVYQHYDPKLLLAWIILTVSIQLFVMTPTLQKKLKRLDDTTFLKVIVYLILFAVLVRLSIFIFADQLPYENRVMISIFFVYGIAINANGTMGYAPLFNAYAIPITFTMLLYWAINPGVVSPGFGEYFLLFLVIFSGLTNTIRCNVLFRLFQKNIQKQQEIGHLNLRLQRSNQSKTRFLASASHDLRQPIHTLSILDGALRQQKLNDKASEIADHIGNSIQRLSSQLDTLLDISKLDSNLVKPNINAINLNSFLSRISDQFKVQAESKGLILKLNLTTDIWIKSDAALLDQIISNILSNSIKYTHKGEISIGVKNEDNQVLITIADSGIGIAKTEHSNIFEEFYQVENSMRERSEGLGLGLSIVERMAALLNINITIDSKLGEGSTVYFHLPACHKPIYLVSELGKQTQVTLAELRILVVDNEVDITASMRLLLESMGATVSEANSVKHALQVFEKETLDILLVDLRLDEEKDGLDLIQEINRVDTKLKCILISADKSADRIQVAKGKGIGFIEKPATTENLLAAICD